MGQNDLSCSLEAYMFVRIEVKFIWFGNNTSVSYVGPFPDKALADSWSEGFNANVCRQQITAKSDFTPDREPGMHLYSASLTPEAVLNQEIETIEELCRG